MRHTINMKKFICLYIPLLIIIFISLVNLFNYELSYFIKQIIWIILGFGLLLCSKIFKEKYIFKYSKYLYYFNLILLGLVLLIGKEINGAKAWFSFKYFSFQPSELMKFSMALYLTSINPENKHFYLKYFIIFLVPSVLVFLEPDTGAIVMYLIIYLSALFFSLKNKKIFSLFCLVGGLIFLVFVLLYIFNIDILVKLLGTSIFYRIDRIINFKNNYQLENALISIGTTELIGRNNKPLIYIPEAITDFMFARVIAFYGFIIGIILIICYIIILFYLIKKIDKSNLGMITFIFFWLFLFQLTQNIFMNLGLLPIMGISLPFLSYGGSNTIIYFIFLALITKKDLVQFKN